jgi:hypothetical protein
MSLKEDVNLDIEDERDLLLHKQSTFDTVCKEVVDVQQYQQQDK